MRRPHRSRVREVRSRAWIDLVCEDEFPLSMFYLQLKGKLEPAGAAA